MVSRFLGGTEHTEPDDYFSLLVPILILKNDGLTRIDFWACAAVSNFYIVSEVRRIKGFKRYRGEKCRTGTGYLEDIKNEYGYLFGEVSIEERKQCFRFVRRGWSLIQRHKTDKKNEAMLNEAATFRTS